MAKRITTHPLRTDRRNRAAALDATRRPASCGHRHTVNGLQQCNDHTPTPDQRDWSGHDYYGPARAYRFTPAA